MALIRVLPPDRRAVGPVAVDGIVLVRPECSAAADTRLIAKDRLVVDSHS